MKFKPNLKMRASLPVIVLLFSILFFSSCKKDDPVGADVGSGSLSMKIDGVDWESKDAIDGAVILESLGTLTITSLHSNGSQLSLGLPTPNQGQTWTFDGGGSVVYKLNVNDQGWIGSGGIGNFSITFSTYNNSKAKGSFSGTLVKFDSMGNQEEIVISNGSFDLNF